MPRLYRPHIPLKVRCRVALRQLGELWPEEFLKEYEGARGQKGKGWEALLEQLLFQLCGLLSCAPEDLHLDHDPALATRERSGEGKQTVYTPDANDPEHLIYRDKHAHHIKTNVRGEHGQHPDRVLIKRAKQRIDTSDIPEADEAWFKRAKLKGPKRKWPKRKIANRKRPWAKRPFRSQKATQTLRRRRGRSARRVRHRLRHDESARA